MLLYDLQFALPAQSDSANELWVAARRIGPAQREGLWKLLSGTLPLSLAR